MVAARTQHVRQRAAGRCEYCRLPQKATSVPFQVDHIISRKHGGRTVVSNLAVACWYCNSFKGSDISGLDPLTRKLARLFNPRRHKWAYHFRWNGPELIGRTAIGRTTVRVLQINCDEAVTLRESLIAEGLFLSRASPRSPVFARAALARPGQGR
jgi:HNH endonuclease